MSTTDTANPYQAPDTMESPPSAQEFCDVGITGSQGRLGRLRYFAYSMALVFVGYLLIGIAFAIGAAVGETASMVIGGLAALAIGIPMIYYTVMIGVRRLHDMNASGWLWLLFLIPLVGSLFALVVLFAPGTQGPNNYGPPPPANPKGLGILVTVLFIIPVIGILAAVALPAYQDYVERANGMQPQFESYESIQTYD